MTLTRFAERDARSGLWQRRIQVFLGGGGGGGGGTDGGWGRHLARYEKRGGGGGAVGLCIDISNIYGLWPDTKGGGGGSMIAYRGARDIVQ